MTKEELFDKDVGATEDFVKNFCGHLTTDKGKRELTKIAKAIRVRYPSYNIRKAVSKYYDDIMGENIWQTEK